MRPIDKWNDADVRWRECNHVMMLLTVAGKFDALEVLRAHERELWALRASTFEAYMLATRTQLHGM